MMLRSIHLYQCTLLAPSIDVLNKQEGGSAVLQVTAHAELR